MYQEVSCYDGLVYEVIKKYENTYQEDDVGGAFLTKRVDVHTQFFKVMKQLIRKRHAGERLSNEDQFWLESGGQKIWEELLK